MAEVDRDQIVQVLTNLVSNAVAAMSNGGTLTIATEGDDNRVRLIVRDTGIGIPREHQEGLRPVLYHETNGQGHGPGTGGDLRHREYALRRHPRAVAVRPGRRPTGTTFTVTLPATMNNWCLNGEEECSKSMEKSDD